MNLIIGGNSQGKLDFALTLLQKSQQMIKDSALMKNSDKTLIDTAFAEKTVADGEVVDFQDAFSRPILNKLHVLLKRLVNQGLDPYGFIEHGLDKNPHITVICDELSTGVIPIAKEDRILQETVGRILCLIAARAENVYRVYCGIPSQIKGKN